jgi:hypothetical protein
MSFCIPKLKFMISNNDSVYTCTPHSIPHFLVLIYKNFVQGKCRRLMYQHTYDVTSMELMCKK